MADSSKITFTNDEVDGFIYGTIPVLRGFEYVDDVDLNESDNHGGAIHQLVLRELGTDDDLYAGEYIVHTGEGSIYEYPREFYPVKRHEQMAVVVNYDRIAKD